MKTDLIKLIIFFWMLGIAYLVYKMWIDVSYMTELVHAYIKMIVEYSRY
jgi:hypothetical protein